MNDVDAHVGRMLNVARYLEARLEQAAGRSLEGAAMLEIGAGQVSILLPYFASRARSAVGIDTDIAPTTGGLADYMRMWRQNGSLRTLKTMARKALGVDARVYRELKRQLAIQQLPAVSVLQMDASAMSFPDNSFDAIYSRAVFEHLADPRACLGEVRRVLKVGGAAVFFFHLYTSVNGCHDARLLADPHSMPYWAHLRPQYRDRIRENAYLNHLRLEEWRELFASELPGSLVYGQKDSSQDIRDALSSLRAAGELSSYTDEELLSVTTEAVWTKTS
jgi:ubiquinone/menaquinone biosynthesis C-methylase UbiE